MDQIVVDVGDADVGVGEVVLMGRQGDAEITADDWARALDTISYEIVCEIGPGSRGGTWSERHHHGDRRCRGWPLVGPRCWHRMHCGRVPGAERRRRRSSWRGTGVEETALLEHGMRVEQIQAILLTGVALSAWQPPMAWSGRSKPTAGVTSPPWRGCRSSRPQWCSTSTPHQVESGPAPTMARRPTAATSGRGDLGAGRSGNGHHRGQVAWLRAHATGWSGVRPAPRRRCTGGGTGRAQRRR